MRLRSVNWSLTSRLLVLSLLVLLAGTAWAGWFLREQLHTAVARNFESGLRDHSERLLSELQASGLAGLQSPRMQRGEFGRIFSGWYWVLQTDGRSYQSRSAWDSTIAVPAANPDRPAALLQVPQGPQQQPLLGLHQPIMLGDIPAQWYVFGPAEDVQREWRRIDQILWITQLGLIAALLTLTILSVRLGLAPLRQLQARLRRIELGEESELGQGFGPDLTPLAETLDQVLRRNAQMIERARHQAADLSHALKKPLAVLALEAQNGHVDGRTLQAHLQTMSRTIDRHLARFGSGLGSGGSQAAALDPVPVLQRLVHLMRQIHAAQALNWSFESPAESTVRWRGAPSDLEEMAGNLLDNAGKWAQSQVVVNLQNESGRLCLVVHDDGPGLADDQLAEAVQRGRRFDERPGGQGLGLAIVQDLADIHGGKLQLGRSPLGGLRATLKL